MAERNEPPISPEAASRIDFVRSVVPRRKPHYLLKGLSLLAFILVIAGLVWLLSGGQSVKPKPNLNNSTSSPAVSLSATTATTSYTSNFFGLSLNYPKTWSLKDSGQGLLTITSPLTNLVAAKGNSVKGEVVFTVVKQGTLPSVLTAGTNLAVLDSSTVTYTSPSTDQSGQTYLSFIQYSTTNTHGGLDAVYVTGNNGYQKDQVVPSSDIANVNPLIYVNFNECAHKQCTKFMPLTIASSSWPNLLGQIINKLIASFVFS